MTAQGGAGTGAAGDFDFFVGSWAGRQRRLREPLSGCGEWDEFSSVTRCWSAFGGAANLDEVVFAELGYRGLTVRLLDPAAGRWSIYWVSSKDGLMDTNPVSGVFANGTGLFYCDQMWRDRAIRVRFTWTGITATTARWEQAFSIDAGATWETNWTADFTRATPS